MPRPTLLCISHSFAPETTPTAIRAGKLLDALGERWSIFVLTEATGASSHSGVRVETVRGRRPARLIGLLRRLRLDKLVELALWPDDAIFWVPSAIRAGRRLIKEVAPSAIVVFMMPYSSGLAGLVLSRLARLPLILNLDDSPTCTDMHPHFPTRLHFRMASWLENMFARRADAVVYVSDTNMRAARERQPRDIRNRYHLVRYGADIAEQPVVGEREDFEIAYVGAMTGWWALAEDGRPTSPLERAYAAWTRLGRFERLRLDQRTSSPAIIGRAIGDVIAEHPAWDRRIELAIYGNPYPSTLVKRALARSGVERVTSVSGPVPHQRVAEIVWGADLLFLTLPKRTDGSEGGRISAKTYEYLATDRPILAAVPRGENWDYLEGKPGVWLVEPDDHATMRTVIAELAGAKFSGTATRFDRRHLHAELSYGNRASELESVIRAAIGAHGNERTTA
ncbi:MAG TPA: glycosyltransferase [Solirubrobacteraceae bacterium]